MTDTGSTYYGLGRRHAPDPRDHRLSIAAPVAASTRTFRYWYDNVWWGDQGSNPFCVGYAWAHFIEDAPTMHIDAKATPFIKPDEIYRQAQLVDEWDGTSYDGTSVRAGAKYLQRIGMIGEYLFAFDVDTIARQVLEVGPVVMGTDWHNSMFTPDSKGMLHIDGPVVGGHAYVINGCSVPEKKFRIKNSWGRSWGQRGNAWISFADLSTLLAANGEAAMTTEVIR